MWCHFQVLSLAWGQQEHPRAYVWSSSSQEAAPVIPVLGLCHINLSQPPQELADNVIKQ